MPTTGWRALALASFLALSGAADAHEGHDHGAPPPPVTATIAPRADASSNDFELVAIARGGALRIYLDRYRDNAPVAGADIEVDTPQGTLAAKPDGEGVYVVAAPFVERPGAYDLAITVAVDGLVDILTTTLTIPEPAATGATGGGFLSMVVGSALAQDLRTRAAGYDLALWSAAAGGFLAGALVMGLARRRPLPNPAPQDTPSRWRARSAAGGGVTTTAILLALLAVPVAADAAGPATADQAAARDIAQRFPDGALFVPKPTQRILGIRTVFTERATHPGTIELPGRVIPDPNGSGYAQASVAGRLVPPPGGFPRLGTRVEAGQVLATVEPALGAADATSQQQQLRELDQQIAITQRRLERWRAIANVVTRQQIEEAELELAGLRERRATLEPSRREPERLVAPITGVIAAVQAVAGQIAEPNAVIFQIVDPTRFWIEALSYESHPIDGDARGRFADGRAVTLAYRGSGLADRNQAIPIQFSVEDGARGLRAGQLLTVLATTTDAREGIAVPRTSVLRGANGQPIVYEHTNAERFVPREVRVEPLDGERVLIVSGVEPARRIVTQGAELLNQIR